MAILSGDVLVMMRMMMMMMMNELTLTWYVVLK